MTVRQPLVLVALDGSPASAMALPAARAVASQLDAILEILFVSERAASISPASVDPIQAYLEHEHVAAHIRHVAGCDPAQAILRATEEEDVSLVVLTTHGREIEPERELGSVSEKVVASVARPILLIRPEAAVSNIARPSELRRLLVPINGTLSTCELLQPAVALARELGASLDLLHIASPGHSPPSERGALTGPRFVDQPQHEWPAWCHEAVSRMAQGMHLESDQPVHVFLASGPISEAILNFAVDHHSDAIVLARSSRLEPDRAHVLRAILRRTPCPVILVGQDNVS
jgi:nucleotide-binding universal stress UspA family protein